MHVQPMHLQQVQVQPMMQNFMQPACMWMFMQMPVPLPPPPARPDLSDSSSTSSSESETEVLGPLLLEDPPLSEDPLPSKDTEYEVAAKEPPPKAMPPKAMPPKAMSPKAVPLHKPHKQHTKENEVAAKRNEPGPVKSPLVPEARWGETRWVELAGRSLSTPVPELKKIKVRIYSAADRSLGVEAASAFAFACSRSARSSLHFVVRAATLFSSNLNFLPSFRVKSNNFSLDNTSSLSIATREEHVL